MNRRQFLFSATAAAAAQNKPNVLFITADDLGLYLGCYGEKRIQTPHMDRLAGQGVRFEVAYVAQASCSPSRSAMFTGLMPHANGQYGLTNSNAGFQLHERFRQATIPNLLKTAGYRTGIIGKLHVDPERSFQFDFRQTPNTTRQVRTVAPQAERFMAGDGPFFLMVNFTDPHAQRDNPQSARWHFPATVDGDPARPVSPSKETLFDWQQVDNAEQRERTANYLNCVARLDTGVGLLLDALERTGKAANTLVIFVGDHGAPFARGKTTVYESGLRVPFLVRWPGVAKPHTSEKMVSTVDILPTILDAAGVVPPHALHGESVRGIVANPKARWREYLAAEFHYHGATPFYPRRAIRDGRYKLIHNLLAGEAKPSTAIDGDTAFPESKSGAPAAARKAFETFADPPEFELYDLRTDPVEFHNLAGTPKHRGAENKLKTALLAWRKATNDPLLTQKRL
ncbi:MAG: sulfatase [Acidobacteria bacterium]|nr:sulfatase [Acidobacteriota bacterium]